MSDTVLIEEEKDIEHIATRKVAVIRKKMMAAFCVMAGIAILIIAVTTGFYELKFRALAAGLYNIDEKSGEYLLLPIGADHLGIEKDISEQILR